MHEKIKLSAPTVVSLIMTDVCNLKCSHCQNYWREEDARTISMTKKQIDILIDRFVEAGIFHVVISGGEPLIVFDELEYAVKKLIESNISISVNSNLTIATMEKIRRLRNAGVDHILTSLNSYDAKTNNYMNRGLNALDKIIQGIKITIEGGISVSSNMIIQRINKDHVYETGRLLSQLGVKNFFGTRSVVPPFATADEKDNYILSPDESMEVLDCLLKAQNDFGIPVSSLISYPLCFLGDLEKYRNFVGRGCPSQSGMAVGIYPDGSVCACCHIDKTYGNIFEKSFREIYPTMREWHIGQHYEGCQDCEYVNMCDSGCRTLAHATYGSFKGPDPLMVGPEGIKVSYRSNVSSFVIDKIKNGAKCTLPESLRFRQEDEFYLINVRRASTHVESLQIGEFVHSYWKSGMPFTIADFPGNIDTLLTLYHRAIVKVDGVGLSEELNYVGHNIAIPSVSAVV